MTWELKAAFGHGIDHIDHSNGSLAKTNGLSRRRRTEYLRCARVSVGELGHGSGVRHSFPTMHKVLPSIPSTLKEQMGVRTTTGTPHGGKHDNIRIYIYVRKQI